MKTVARIASTTIAVTALALPAATADAAIAGPSSSKAVSTVFVQTNNLRANAVVVYDRGRDGSLRKAHVYRTGGAGGMLQGSVVDHLASQGSLTYDAAHRLLYAVNAGSNTLSVFAVRGDRLRRTQVITSGGRFPVSVASHGRLVYVLNALKGGSVQGYVLAGNRLVRNSRWHRGLHLNPKATPQFTNTPGQVAFSPDGTQLVVTTKANGDSIDVFGVNRFGAPSTKPVVNVEPGAVPFAVTFGRGGSLVVAESSTNAAVATFRLARNGHVALIRRVPTGQQATCWVTSSRSLLFAGNAGSSTESSLRDHGRGRITLLGDTPTSPGTVDSAATPDGRYLYVQTGGKGIVDGFRVNRNGSLTLLGWVIVPGAVGGQGIVAL